MKPDSDPPEKPSDPDQKDSGNASWKQAMMSMGLALGIPTTLGVPLILGIYLDRRFHTEPIFFLLLGLLGVVGSAIELFNLWKIFSRND